jgi:hemerythrin
MPLLEWSESYSVGLPQFDQDHEHMFTVLNYLHNAMRCGQDPVIISGSLEELWLHTERHFRAEETFMQAMHYPGFAAHKSEHLSVLLQMANLKERYEHGEAHLNSELIELLLNSLEHIEGSDQRAADFSASNPCQQVPA